MSRRSLRQAGPAALDLIDEAVHRLRLSPVRLLASYFLGTVPFVLALLYFWADMSRGAFAYQHCAEAALGLALAYLWLKCWQAGFAHQLYRQLAGRSPVRWTWRRIGRLVSVQTLLQPTAFLALPVAAVAMLPFGWVYGFYHNLSVFGDGEPESLRETIRRAWRQAALWPRQNHVAISVLWLFGLFVWGNVFIGLVFLPHLVKMFLGVETAFTMSASSVWNTTFLAVTGCVTYLCLNPLIKTVYVLRCFYGESLATGADLKADLQSLARAGAVALLLLVLSAPAAVAATPDPKPPAENRDLAAQLDRSISEVISRTEYTWRLPREKAPEVEAEKGLLTRFLDAIVDSVASGWRTLKRHAKRLGDWIDDWLRRHLSEARRTEPGSGNWLGPLHTLLFILVALVASLLAVLCYRAWKQRRRRRRQVVAEPLQPTPDVADENVVADQLPTDGWLARARELLAAGDRRLALRAWYLACLAYLGQQEIIVIARFKSNCDYERELRRRAPVRRQMLEAFAENVSLFESSWYGMHEVTPEILEQFTANFQRIREAP